MYIHMYYVYISLLFDDKRLDCGRHLSVFLLAHRAITYIFNNWWSRSECTAHTAHTMACASPMHYSIRLRLLSKIRSWCWRLVHFPKSRKNTRFFFILFSELEHSFRRWSLLLMLSFQFFHSFGLSSCVPLFDICPNDCRPVDGTTTTIFVTNVYVIWQSNSNTFIYYNYSH